MVALLLGALSLEVLLTPARVTLHLDPVPADRVALATKSFSRSTGPMALVLVVKIYLYFLIRQALVGEPTPGERLPFW